MSHYAVDSAARKVVRYGSGRGWAQMRTDTVKTIDAEESSDVNRDEIILVETPQVFLKGVTKAYEQAFAEGYTGTDADNVWAGKDAVGSPEENFKLTIPTISFGRTPPDGGPPDARDKDTDIHALVPGKPN